MTPEPLSPDDLTPPAQITMHGGIRVDRTEWPVFRVDFPGRRVNDAELTSYLVDVQTGMNTRRTPYAVVVNIGPRPMLTADQRKMIADWMNRNQESIRRYLRGYAYVVSSRAARLALRSIFWFAPPPVDIRLFAEVAPAMAWARAQVSRDA